MKTIGLFGTCGKSKWRNSFINEYNNYSISYYNPQVEDGKWTPDFSEIENFHFLNDDIVIFSITSETPSLGSLAETGFSALSVLFNSSNKNRFFIVYIDNDCQFENNDLREESIRSRILVKSKLKELSASFDRLILTESLNESLKISIDLYNK